MDEFGEFTARDLPLNAGASPCGELARWGASTSVRVDNATPTSWAFIGFDIIDFLYYFASFRVGPPEPCSREEP